MSPPSDATPAHRSSSLSSTLTIFIAALSALLLYEFLPHHARSHIPSRLSVSWNSIAAPFTINFADANIAYFIQATNATAAHVPRLVTRLHHAKNVILVHFDAKVDQLQVASIERTIRHSVPEHASNVYFLPSQIVTYAGFSMVLNTISGMDGLLKLHKDHPWDYFINLSGSDYPVVNAISQRRILGNVRRQSKRGRNFFTIDRRHGTWESFLNQRFRMFHVDELLTRRAEDSSLTNSSVANPLATYQLPFETLKASAWMVLEREFVQYAVDSDLSRKLIAIFGFMRACDEHFFATLAYNSAQFKPTIAGNSLRHDIWVHDGNRSGNHPFLLDAKAENGSYVFLDRIKIGFHFNARKFREADSELMDIIDEIAADNRRNARINKEILTLLRRKPEEYDDNYFIPS